MADCPALHGLHPDLSLADDPRPEQQLDGQLGETGIWHHGDGAHGGSGLSASIALQM